MASQELDLLASASAVDTFVDDAYQRMVALADAGDVNGLGSGIAAIDHVADRIQFLRREAGARTYELLGDENYRYRGQAKTRKAPWQDEDGTLRVEPVLSGGGWRRFDYASVLRSVAHKAWGLDSRIVTTDGEVVGTVEDVITEVCRCVSFSNVKADYEKGTGLAKWGIERSEIGEWAEARKDVKVQQSKEGTT